MARDSSWEVWIFQLFAETVPLISLANFALDYAEVTTLLWERLLISLSCKGGLQYPLNVGYCRPPFLLKFRTFARVLLNPKLYFMHYSCACVGIMLLNIGLCKYAFLTYSFGKLVYRVSVLSVCVLNLMSSL